MYYYILKCEFAIITVNCKTIFTKLGTAFLIQCEKHADVLFKFENCFKDCLNVTRSYSGRLVQGYFKRAVQPKCKVQGVNCAVQN
jgi:hypothetical protein